VSSICYVTHDPDLENVSLSCNNFFLPDVISRERQLLGAMCSASPANLKTLEQEQRSTKLQATAYTQRNLLFHSSDLCGGEYFVWEPCTHQNQNDAGTL
jgi:hypothetical protein